MRPLTEKQKALLDEMSRSTDPREEAIQQLCYELEHGSDITRRAFVAELLRARVLIGTARAHRRRLPPIVQTKLEACEKPKNFEHLVALAEGRLEEELQPGSSG